MILPHLEGNTIYDKADFGDDGFSGSTNAQNRALINGTNVAMFDCPSTPCPKFVGAEAWNGSVQVHVGSMVAIAGAIDEPTRGIDTADDYAAFLQRRRAG